MGNQWKQCQTLFFWGSKVTADGDCSHEIKRRLLLWRKVMTNLDSIFKSRDIYYFANKGLSSQGYGFSSGHVWMWELDCEECWAPENWCFWTVVLEKTLESPLACKEIQQVHSKGDQSWMFFGMTDAKVKLQYFGHLMQGVESLENTLMLGGIGGRRRRGRQRMRRLDASPTRWTWVWVNFGSWWWTGRPGVLWFMESQRVGHHWATELSWTKLNQIVLHIVCEDTVKY